MLVILSQAGLRIACIAVMRKETASDLTLKLLLILHYHVAMHSNI